jgi:hypothetical protein
VNLHNIAIQFAFLYAPLIHTPVEQVTPNLYRGQDPKVAEIYALKEKGIKTIISLRTNPERSKAELCKKLGMNWYQIKTGVFKTPSDDQFDEFRKIVNNPKNQPCYASCEIDMDRTGVYIAAYRMVDQHWTTQQMIDEFNSHHQKKWWPIFRKYEAKVVAYSKRKGQDPGDTSVLNTTAVKLPAGKDKVSPDANVNVSPANAVDAKPVPATDASKDKKAASPQSMPSNFVASQPESDRSGKSSALNSPAGKASESCDRAGGSGK